MNLVTFTTDFGISDPYVGEVKGVVDAISPDTRIIDITHDVEQGNVLQASFLLTGSYRYFADHALHLVVVDPGVLQFPVSCIIVTWPHPEVRVIHDFP